MERSPLGSWGSILPRKERSEKRKEKSGKMWKGGRGEGKAGRASPKKVEIGA
jgi:hypothetical protein